MLTGISASTMRMMAIHTQRTPNRIAPVTHLAEGSGGFPGSGHPGADGDGVGHVRPAAQARIDAHDRSTFDFADAQRSDGVHDVTTTMLSRHNAYVAGQRATRGGKGRMSAYESVMNMTA